MSVTPTKLQLDGLDGVFGTHRQRKRHGVEVSNGLASGRRRVHPTQSTARWDLRRRRRVTVTTRLGYRTGLGEELAKRSDVCGVNRNLPAPTVELLDRRIQHVEGSIGCQGDDDGASCRSSCRDQGQYRDGDRGADDNGPHPRQRKGGMGRTSSGPGGDVVDESSRRDAQDPAEQCWEQLGDGQPRPDLAGRGADAGASAEGRWASSTVAWVMKMVLMVARTTRIRVTTATTLSTRASSGSPSPGWLTITSER